MDLPFLDTSIDICPSIYRWICSRNKPSSYWGTPMTMETSAWMNGIYRWIFHEINQPTIKGIFHDYGTPKGPKKVGFPPAM